MSSPPHPESPPAPNPAGSPEEASGGTIDRYRILEKIGEGGSGVVYVAEQTEPVRRRVALKLIKLGMDTRAVVARFELERQALAVMDHPNIAKVLDAGATEAGRPYFVMELAQGYRITEYCERHQLTIPQRLALFIQVCHAVQHAHQKGVIHRDLKPSNILVVEHEGGAVPKVIDFGIAMATGQGFETATGLTSVNQFLGSPPYMSPEQVEFGARDIDTRSDIYSLGVILYELLAGQPPFDPHELLEAGLDEMRRIIREVDPPRPSDRLAAGQRPGRLPSVSPLALIRERTAAVRGDLDWIVMKCLEKDRARRYETANGLAFDLLRYLRNEPVNARPPSHLYRLRKAIHRHRIVFGAGVAVTVALVLGLSFSAWQATRALASERQALRTAYSSDLSLARLALSANNLGRAQALLERNRPRPGQADLRGWEWRYLWGQTRPDEHQAILEGTNRLGNLSFSPNGAILALEITNTIRLRDLTRRTWIDWQDTGRLPVFARQTNFLAYHRRKSGSADILVVRDLGAGRTRREIPQPGEVLALAWTGDAGSLLVLTAQPTTQAIYSPAYRARRVVTAWDLESGQARWFQPIDPVEESTPTGLAVSPDGASFAVAIAGGRCRAHDAGTGRERFVLQVTTEFVTALAYSPDGSTLATGTGYTDSVVLLWDARTGAARGRLDGHRSWITSLEFTRDGRHLLTASADQTVRRWNLADLVSDGVFRGHGYTLNRVAVSPDGRTLASNTLIGEAFLWPMDRPSEHPGVRRLPGRVVSAVFTPDGRSLLTAEPDGSLALRDLASLAERRRWHASPESASGFVRLAPDGSRAALFGTNGRASVWDLAEDRHTSVLPAGDEPVVECLFTSEGRYLVTIVQRSDGMGARIWSLREGRFTGALSLDRARAFAAPALPHSLVVAAPDRLELWNVERPEAVPRVLMDSGDFAGFAVAPGRSLGAGAFTESYVQVWDLATLRPLETLRGLLLGAHSVAFSPDGTRLVAGSNGHEAVMMWDVATGQEVLSLAGEGSLFEKVAFSPDGHHLLGINAAGTAHLWSAPAWEEIEPGRPRPREARVGP